MKGFDRVTAIEFVDRLFGGFRYRNHRIRWEQWIAAENTELEPALMTMVVILPCACRYHSGTGALARVRCTSAKAGAVGLVY